MLKTRIERPRIAWLDLLRGGGGISLVVIGHCLSECALRSWIYNFHVPLLFMLSGFLNQYLHGGARRFRPKRILLPYMIWALLSSLAWFVGLKGDFSVTRLITDIVPVHGFTSWNDSLWFLYALFFVDILKPQWHTEASKVGCIKMAESFMPLVVFLMLVVAANVVKPEWNNVLAWKNVVLGIACYCLGEMIAYFEIIEWLNTRVLLSILLFVIGSVVGLLNGGVSTYGCCYGRSIFMLATSSICVSLSLMVFFKRFEKRLPSVLSLLGKCSLFIMVSHYFALIVVNHTMRAIGISNAYIQVAAGLAILAGYMLYFKLIALMRINEKLPDYLGGYTFSKAISERNIPHV